MLEIFDELAFIGDDISEEDRVVHLLASLPDSYNVLVIALEANENVPKMEVVVERITHEEKKIKERSSTTKDDHVFSAVTRNRSRKPKGPVCYYCKKVGHIQRNCYLHAQHEKNSKSSGSQSSKGINFDMKSNGARHHVNQMEAKPNQFEADVGSDSDIGLVVSHVLSST